MHFLTRDTRSIIDILLIGVFGIVSLVAAGSIACAARPDDGIIGVVFAPWTDSATAMAAALDAGARFVRFGGAGFVVVVSPEGDGFREKAGRNGALMFIDPKFAGACMAEEPK